MSEEWHPGSFTKNFSWGPADRGLKELHSLIRVGFNNSLEDVPRALFRQRTKLIERPDYIPLNFFLYNKIKNGVSYVMVDELVFQAINFRHSSSFDKLALYAFNLSSVGTWKGAASYQSHPALWAKSYIVNRIAQDFRWTVSNVTADDIENYVKNDPRYQARTARKLATNLNYLYKQGRLSEYRSNRPERWWLSALFLTLDRATSDILARGSLPKEAAFEEYLIKQGFHQISGPRSMEKDLAAHHFKELYAACGATSRFSEQAALERQKILLPQVQYFANNPEPVGVFHASNPYARGAIPRACAMLACYVADFQMLDLDEIDDFNVEDFIKENTKSALARIQENPVKTSMTVDELLKITRGE